MTSAAAKAAHAARAAKRVGRAMDVVRVPGAIGRDAGREGPLSGGLNHPLIGHLPVGVTVTGSGMMMTPTSSDYFATRMVGHSCNLVLGLYINILVFPGQSVSP